MSNTNTNFGTNKMTETKKLRLILRRCTPVSVTDPYFAKVDLDLEDTGTLPSDWEVCGFVHKNDIDLADGVTAGDDFRQPIFLREDLMRMRENLLTIIDSVIVNKTQNEAVKGLVHGVFNRAESEGWENVNRVNDKPADNLSSVKATFSFADAR